MMTCSGCPSARFYYVLPLLACLAFSGILYVTMTSRQPLLRSFVYWPHASIPHGSICDENLETEASSGQANRMQNSMMCSLRTFKTINDQQLYLYEILLKQKWTANLTNMGILRQELAEYRSELGDRTQIVLHQHNVRPKQNMIFVFSEKVMTMPNYFFKQLPKSNPFSNMSQGTSYRSCAVVGNSGIMLNSSCGKDIDIHDYVFRCNLAPLAPFKKDAGTKNNLTTMNPSLVSLKYEDLKKKASIKKYNEEISQYDGMIWMPCYSYHDDFYLVKKALTSYKEKKTMMVCGNPKHFRSVVDFWKERELNSKISTGFYLVTTAIQLCDEVQLYGFWPFPTRYGDMKSDVPYHYFDDVSVDRANLVHSMDTEFNLLVQLHALGILRLNVGSCS